MAGPDAREPGSLSRLGSQSLGGEGGLQMDPVLGWEVEERQQRLSIFCDPVHGLGPLGREAIGETLEGLFCVLAVLGVTDLLEADWERVRHTLTAAVMTLAMDRLGEDISQGRPTTRCPRSAPGRSCVDA